MSRTRPTLPMHVHEDEVLRTLYRDFNIPTDQYPQRPDDLIRLVESWNSLTGRREAPPDVLHYMISRRKKGRWEKLGRDAGRDFVRPTLEFSSQDLGHLDAIHEELQIASDNFALNSESAVKLQHEFARRSGRIVPAMILAAEMISRRKAGALATLKPIVREQDVGFADINEVAN
jgi:hypothetical protein